MKDNQLWEEEAEALTVFLVGRTADTPSPGTGAAGLETPPSGDD